MKRPSLAVLALLVAIGLWGQAFAAAAETPENFGVTAAGEPVEQFTLTNDRGMSATFITRGATLTRLLVPDRSGKPADVVLGFDDVAGYESDRNQYFGCIVGRVANRIAKGKFTLDGKEYRLAINNDPNHLHGGGGPKALDRVLWQGKAIDTKLGPGVRFTYTSPDGEEGYPGTVRFTVTYLLTDNELRMTFAAKADRNTPVNLSQHTYFNLAGQGAASVLDHELTLFADKYTPVDATLIPTGELATVAGTPLDFRPQQKSAATDNKPRTIGSRIEKLIDSPTKGYDHNFVLQQQQPGELTKAAVLRDPGSGRTLTVFTTQPGVQLYTGNFLFGQQGKAGQKYAQRSAVCLETQHFPDAVNHSSFPSVIVGPDKPYRETCVYRFSAE